MIEPIGGTAVEPETVFFWDTDLQTTVEVTILGPERGEDRFLIRTTKTYRLLKQDPDGRQNWQRNLVKLNEYLREAFSSFRISADYIDSVDGSITGVTDNVDVLGEEAGQLVSERQQLTEQLESTQEQLSRLEQSITGSSEVFQHRLQVRGEELQDELEAVNQEIESLTDHLYRKRQELGEWEDYGVGLAYLFTVSTDAALIRPDEVDRVLEGQANEIRNEFYHSVNQILSGENFKLAFEELTEPRVFNRLEHTSLLNPDRLEDLREHYPDFEAELSELSEQSIRQYNSYAAYDLEADTGVFEYSNATPAQAVNSVVKQLDVGKVASGSNAPSDGPYIGNVAGTQQAVGFDPANPSNGLSHLYIAGATGSGKSYTKRVLLENVASLGYDVLSITPSDAQSIGVSFANPEHDSGQGISADQYWVGSELLLDEPDNVHDLFSGINVVTLKDLPETEKQSFVDRVFSALYEMDELDKPLYVFLEEAHNFDSGAAAEAIQDIVREARKHGIHAVLVSHSPTDFSHSQKHIRENTSTVFMQGEYTSYADNFGFLDKREITGLETGQAIFASRDFPKTYVDVRLPLTLPEIPSDQQIDELDQKHSVHLPDLEEANKRQERQQPDEKIDSTDFEGTGAETKSESEAGKSPSKTVSDPDLEDEEQRLLRFIKQYIREEDQTPTYSKCHREGPFGTKKTKRILLNLIDKDRIEKEPVIRGGQETESFRIV
jgi:hypothetical protein